MDLSEYEGTGLKAEDLIHAPEEDVRKETLDAERRMREEATIEEQILRLEMLIQSEKSPGPSLLGVRLALEMGLEIKEQIPLGSKSALLIKDWQAKYSSTAIEECIAIAKTFLLKPNELTAAIRQKLFDGRA